MVRMGQMNQCTPVEFWRMKRVSEVTGLSKSEVYRRVEAGCFPKPRKYPDSHMDFWISVEVIEWQRDVVGADEFDALLG